ncbi:MAG: glycoside hydrolase family 5 protein [Chloroflexi bacterium]|nr:glycoside hydrolase family 5 protein [Chloroflexota bacterium]
MLLSLVVVLGLFGLAPISAFVRAVGGGPGPATGGGREPGRGDVTAKWFGVSIAGGEFGEASLPGIRGTDYVYPADQARSAYFASKGLTLARLPVRWERVQRAPLTPLDAGDLSAVRAALDAAHSGGQRVIVDLHNFGRYYGRPLGRDDATAFADVWERLAVELRNHPAIFGYELMNEPHDLPDGSNGWAQLAQEATTAIRKHDMSHWILVPGYHWQTAHLWPENNLSLEVRDPAGRLLYAAHQYFDANFSGRYRRGYDQEGATATVGVERLRPFLDWLAIRKARGILTEYGVPDTDPRWLEVLDRFLATLQSSAAIEGGLYWAAGPWWHDDPLAIEPRNGLDRPQMAVLSNYQSTR